MPQPDIREFIRKSRRGNLIPVYKEIYADLETPLSAFNKIDDGENSYLLESAESQERIGRYSFLGSSPSIRIEYKSGVLAIKGRGRRPVFKSRSTDPLGDIKRFMGQFEFVPVDGLPIFCGGLVGYIGYDVIRSIEEIPDTCVDDLELPDIKLLLTNTILIFDRVRHTIKIVSNAHIKNNTASGIRRAYKEAIENIDKIEDRLRSELRDDMPQLEGVSGPAAVKSNVKKGDFKKSVLRAKEYIRSGDIIQVVLSQRFEADFKSNPLNVYRALRSVNPSPYMFYLSFENLKLIGSSPEIMVRCEASVAEIRPIAGTRRRGRNEKEDKRLEMELLSDPKERAEHLMLVDLGRNDLGRACEAGTVKVREFMGIERYSHVMHIVSDCVGRLSKRADIYKLLKASFPAGTVAGAPKIRAMEIIDELEKAKRGPYAGCVGYFSFSGNLDTCITIRTIVIKNDKAYIQAGAGIVADSNPEREYDETFNKARAMLKAVSIAKGMKR